MNQPFDVVTRQAFSILLLRSASIEDLQKMAAHPKQVPALSTNIAPLSDQFIMSFLAEGTIAFIDELYDRLLAHGSDTSEDKDYAPLLRMYLPCTTASWLISELDPECSDIAFGLCDLGIGFPEFGSVSILELLSIGACCDFSFTARYPLSVYARAARELDTVTVDEAILQAHAQS